MARKPITPAVKVTPAVAMVPVDVPTLAPPVAESLSPMVDLRDHELHVLHTGRNIKQIVSKRFYHDNAGDLEVLQGEPGEPIPSPHLKRGVSVFRNKMDTPAVDNKVVEPTNDEPPVVPSPLG